jgi:hypothetical protein
MAEMTRSSVASVLAPEFDDFLFAPIGEERNGMLLSVISALARLNIDPWQEAANLAQLPRPTAARRLALLIASLPERPSATQDAGTIATRLIERLPRRLGLNTTSATGTRSVDIPAVMRSQAFRYVAFILILVVLGGLSVVASQRSAVPVDNAGAPISRSLP